MAETKLRSGIARREGRTPSQAEDAVERRTSATSGVGVGDEAGISRRRFCAMRLFALLALVLPLAACGGGASSSSSAETDLEITVWPGGRSGDSTTHRIRCPGDGRCERLAALPAR